MEEQQTVCDLGDLLKNDPAEFQKQEGPHPVDSASHAKYFRCVVT